MPSWTDDHVEYDMKHCESVDYAITIGVGVREEDTVIIERRLAFLGK